MARLAGVPIELLLTAVRGPARLEVEEPAGAHLDSAVYRIDAGPWEELAPAGRLWLAELNTQGLEDGVHRLEVRVIREDGLEETLRGSFRVHNRPR